MTPTAPESRVRRAFRPLLAAWLLSTLTACGENAATTAPAPADHSADLTTAEGFIDAFYSFDADALGAFMEQAPESAPGLLYYQGWAEGGNYLVLDRKPCAVGDDGVVNCPVTVQDDPVVALGTGFNVTDTFHLTFTDGVITKVDTSSNDQEIYYQARQWVEANMPEVVEGPCANPNTPEGTPGDCARAMTAGYAAFAASDDFPGVPPLPESDDAPTSAPAATFVPADFDVPVRVEAEGFVVRPLGPDLVDIDYAAYMSSIEHLQRTFTRSTNWPREGITDEEAMLDMETEQGRFEARSSFAYAVLTPDGTRERGCIYVYPGSKPGYDAEVSLWVTQAEFDDGFDAELEGWARTWIEADWPFENVAWPGRSIPWETWDALPDA